MQLLKETYFSNTYSMKRSIYNFLVQASAIVLWPTRFFSPKMRLFLDGRKGVFKELSNKIGEDDKTIWFHCASLGEYEQGLPIMEAVRKMYPGHKLVLSFFSPSGYEVRKNAPIADVVTYLPLDTRSNATKFIKTVHPELAFFVKYEFWPNYLFELKNSKIPVYLISGIFSKDQAFFKAGGNILRDALKSFHHFFVQDKESLQVLKQLGFENASLSGDTRFDHQWQGRAVTKGRVYRAPPREGRRFSDRVTGPHCLLQAPAGARRTDALLCRGRAVGIRRNDRPDRPRRHRRGDSGQPGLEYQQQPVLQSSRRIPRRIRYPDAQPVARAGA